jgi:hypothetical protein
MNRSLVVLALLSSATTAYAGPVLLAAFDNHVHGPGYVFPETQVQFILELVGSEDYVDLGTGYYWSDGDTGTIDLTPSTDPGFPLFAELITNGVDDRLGDGIIWTHQGYGGGVLYDALESDILGLTPDLTGSRLDFVRLIVRSVEFEPEIMPDDRIGYRVNYDLTFQFYGVAVPEPSTLFCILGGLAAILGRILPRRNHDMKVQL